MRVLLTGFEPFGGETVNSSQETVRTVSCDEFGDIEVVTDILPVSFNRVEKALCGLIDEKDPDVVIMLGQSGLSDCIKIERVALNLMDSVNGDNDEYTPDEETICPDAPPAYFTQLPVKKLRDCLIQTGIPAKTSSSAGLYVCNRTYFAALHHIATTGRSTKAVFIHLPKISDEWPAERMRTAIILIINNIITMAKKTTAAKPAAKKTTTAKPAAKKATTTKKTTTKAAAKPAAKPAAKTVEKKATEISVTGNKKIGTLMKDFNKKFPYLRLGIFYSYAREQVAKGETIYNIDVEKTLASVRRADSGGDISISGNKKIKSLEKEFDTVFGLYAQVCYTTAEGNRYYTSRGLDDYTLAAFNAKCEKDGCKKGEWK